MARPALRIEVSSKDRKELQSLVSSGVQQVRVVLRALALLQLAKGVSAPRISGMIPLTPQAIRKVGHRYQLAPVTRLRLEWEAATRPRLFPLMKAELSIYPLTATETQLDFSGLYKPPFGALGKAMNAIVGHRIAEVSVHRFVSDVAEYLRQVLP
jgi:hypothetical protein